MLFIKEIYNHLTEEKMLHEEVELKWEELQSIVQDFQFLEQLRSSLINGVSSYLTYLAMDIFILEFGIFIFRALHHLLDRGLVHVRFSKQGCTLMKYTSG